MSHDETVTQTLTGNGLVIERTEKPGALVPWWWISDERHVPKSLTQTYRHRETLKAYGCRWSKRRHQWYYIGRDLPDELAALVGPEDAPGQPVVHDSRPVPDVSLSPRYSPHPKPTVLPVRASYQARVLRRFAE